MSDVVWVRAPVPSRAYIREEEEGGRRSEEVQQKNKNPTRQCGEKGFSFACDSVLECANSIPRSFERRSFLALMPRLAPKLRSFSEPWCGRGLAICIQPAFSTVFPLALLRVRKFWKIVLPLFSSLVWLIYACRGARGLATDCHPLLDAPWLRQRISKVACPNHTLLE